MKIILIAAISLNGKIAASPDQSSLEWTSKEDTRFFVEKTKECGVMIMGRKTYETIGKPLKGRRIVVMTRTKLWPELVEGDASVEFTDTSPKEILRNLASREYASVVITGGANIYSLFLKEKLVDEIFLTVEPILFGNGISLAELFGDVPLELVETKMLGEQSVMLHYKVKK